MPPSRAPAGSGPNAARCSAVDASNGDIAAADVCIARVLPTGTSHCGLADLASASNEPSVHLVKGSATKEARMEFFFFSKSTTLTGRLMGPGAVGVQLVRPALFRRQRARRYGDAPDEVYCNLALPIVAFS
ncbi:MAG: hypothetical protein ABR540_22835 [Acidimicrobiales bacterium]